MGVEPFRMLMAWPADTAAPHVPQKPHVPPGTCMLRLRSSASAASLSSGSPAGFLPPEFAYAVMSAAPMSVWCSGPFG